MSSTKEKREAFIAGARQALEGQRVFIGPVGPGFDSVWQDFAKKAYPPKTETRPREVTLIPWSHRLYRITNGVIEMSDGYGWRRSHNAWLDADGNLVIHAKVVKHYPSAVAGFVDLVNNPTETVEVSD